MHDSPNTKEPTAQRSRCELLLKPLHEMDGYELEQYVPVPELTNDTSQIFIVAANPAKRSVTLWCKGTNDYWFGIPLDRLSRITRTEYDFSMPHTGVLSRTQIITLHIHHLFVESLKVLGINRKHPQDHDVVVVDDEMGR